MKEGERVLGHYGFAPQSPGKTAEKQVLPYTLDPQNP